MKEIIQIVLHQPLDVAINSLDLYHRTIIAGFIILVAWLLSVLVKRISKTRLVKKYEDPLLSTFIANIIRMVINLIGLIIAIKIMQLNELASGILAGAGISAFVFGFALKDIGENFLSGILLASSRPFRVGDLIECNTIKGVVTALNLKDTELKTSDGKDVFIPNSVLIKNALINYTLDNSNRYQFSITLPVGSNVIKTKEVMEEVMNQLLAQNEYLQKPSVQLSDISSSGYQFTIYYWLTSNTVSTATSIKSTALTDMIAAFEQHAISLKD
ncbi:MAG: mechanosensitive ion channel [Bacteroidetes bacterium]|nr:mechanosensitive ion channel [Bacteroidota bacterium]